MYFAVFVYLLFKLDFILPKVESTLQRNIKLILMCEERLIFFVQFLKILLLKILIKYCVFFYISRFQYILGYCNDAKKHPSLRLSSFNFAISMFQLVDIGFNGLILPNSTSWHVIFAKLKLLENIKSFICYTLM